MLHYRLHYRLCVEDKTQRVEMISAFGEDLTSSQNTHVTSHSLLQLQLPRIRCPASSLPPGAPTCIRAYTHADTQIYIKKTNLYSRIFVCTLPFYNYYKIITINLVV